VGDWRGERAARAILPAAVVAAALAVSLAAGAIQAGDSLTVRIGWDLDHNGLYHLVQIVGVVLLVRGLTLTLR